MPLPRLVFQRVELVRRLPSVLLRRALPHELLVVFRQVLLEPRCGFHRPDASDHKGRTASQEEDGINSDFYLQTSFSFQSLR